MRAFAITVVLLIICVHSNAQENCLTWNENNRLRWDDFSGKVNDTSKFDAESYAEVKFTYTFNSPRDFQFKVVANFNRDISWIKQGYKTDALLKHEQTHFDIAALFSGKLQFAFDNYSYTSNFENEIRQIFNQVKKNYHKTQQQYDEETNHSTNVLRQMEWEILIKKELDKLKENNTNWKEPLFVANE